MAADNPDPLRAPPPPVRWDTVTRVHLMGICGSAMAALAAMLAERGFEVRGSDASPYPPMSDFLAARKIPVMKGYDAPANLDWGPDVVIVGNVVRPTYPEALAMRERGLAFASLPEALAALFLAGKQPIVVTGTHGKTTTSSMTAWLLEVAGLEPSFFIGGVAGNWRSNHHLGHGRPFVVEGDEYDTAFWDRGSKFLHYRPELAAIGNLEMDHADIFADVEAVEATFTRFARLVPPHGRLVVPAWEARARRAASATSATVQETFIAHSAADAGPAGATVARNVQPTPEGTRFELHLPGHDPVDVTLPIAGRHNVMNALVAASLAAAAGADPATFPRAFATFELPYKRLTTRGEVAGIPVVDDFAHHPTAIAATIDAIRQRYPGRRLVALFEAQSNTARRKVFQDGFGVALARADRVWFKRALEKASDPLPVADRLDLGELCQGLVSRGVEATVIPEVQALAEAVVADARPGDVLLVMSGRDFEGIHRRLLEGLEHRFGGG
ncbi:MAG: UDP-N-acetylmuramate dehydrogenase [Deltaproteobacteria bacterium]|nr:UDP-N-acetylmuramate dehydrogenase [Deltaproteobacteria bacterium]